MKSLILFVVFMGLYFVFNSDAYLGALDSVLPKKTTDLQITLLSSVIFGAVAVLVSSFVYNTKEGFFFEKDWNRPKCCKTTVGRPISFEYTSDADRFTEENCVQVNKQLRQDPQRFGWDGFLGRSITIGNVPNEMSCYPACPSLTKAQWAATL